ncbi:hypothetical protein AgCh_028382 [Apium graveolens]
MAEVASPLFGLEIAYRLGYSRVILKSDARNVIATIKKDEAGYSPIFLFYDDIRRKKSRLEWFDCSHVKRSGNTVAHFVSRWNNHGPMRAGLVTCELGHARKISGPTRVVPTITGRIAEMPRDCRKRVEPVEIYVTKLAEGLTPSWAWAARAEES